VPTYISMCAICRVFPRILHLSTKHNKQGPYGLRHEDMAPNRKFVITIDHLA
jgi:hypothetical protein